MGVRGELSYGKTSDLVLNFKFELLLPPRNLWQNAFCDIGGQKKGKKKPRRNGVFGAVYVRRERKEREEGGFA